MPLTDVTTSTFDNEVLKAPGLVLVDFWAEWCGPCKMLTPLLKEVAAELPDKVKIVKVNIDNESTLASRYAVQYLPTMIYFKNGEILDQRSGLTSKKDLVTRVNTLA
ncbi:MAG: thioredoxin [Candidatus Methylacidiphilales bacterium]|nr:thioredoxin [Candidatus Methylacidiphilales bacterium]